MSNSSSSSSPCTHCGCELPAGVPESQCPRCLMAQVMEPTQAGDSRAAMEPLGVEELVPHFPQLEILECLGRGGMGVVYKARQKSLGRLVALKLLAPERAGDPQFAARFESEARALAALNHPHIVGVYDFGQAGGFYYLLMEFVDGMNLRQLLQARRLTPEEALSIVPPVCDALQCAHEHGIVHRDIKPENILMDKAGGVKIADFGIAKIVGREGPLDAAAHAGSGTTAQATFPLGTPDYAAPEQFNGTADHRADIYSLGVVLYEMLTGERPKDKIEVPSKRVLVDIRIDEIVLRALEKEPELRFATAAEFRTRVAEINVPPASPQASPPRMPDSGKWYRRGGIMAVVAGLALLLGSSPLNEIVDDYGLTQNARKHLAMRRQTSQRQELAKVPMVKLAGQLKDAERAQNAADIERLTRDIKTMNKMLARLEADVQRAAEMKQADEKDRIAMFYFVAGGLIIAGLWAWFAGRRTAAAHVMKTQRLLICLVLSSLTMYAREPERASFACDFEQEQWQTGWNMGNANLPRNLALVSESSLHKIRLPSGKALEITLKQGTHYGADFGFDFTTQAGPEPEEATLSYKLCFAHDFNAEAVQGGKLPGFGGIYSSESGAAGKRVNGRDSWSARGAYWKPDARGHIPIGFYVYHADMKSDFGDTWYFSKALERGQWHDVRLYIKLNSPAAKPGGKGRSNGILRGWLNGRHVFEKRDIRFRDVDSLKIRNAWFHFYHGGGQRASEDYKLWLDDVVITAGS